MGCGAGPDAAHSDGRREVWGPHNAGAKPTSGVPCTASPQTGQWDASPGVGGGMQLRLGLGSLGVSAKRGLSLWGIKEPFDGQGLRAVVMGPRSQSELSHGIQETELKRLKELFFRALLCFFSTCLSYEQRWYKRMAGTGPIALRLGVGRRTEEGEQGEGLSTAPDGMEMEGERRGQGCSAAAPGSAPPGE